MEAPTESSLRDQGSGVNMAASKAINPQRILVYEFANEAGRSAHDQGKAPK